MVLPDVPLAADCPTLLTKSAVWSQPQYGSPALKSAWANTLRRYSSAVKRWSGAPRRRPRPLWDQSPVQSVTPQGLIVEPRAEIDKRNDRCPHHLSSPASSSATENQNVIDATIAPDEDSFGFVASFGQHRG